MKNLLASAAIATTLLVGSLTPGFAQEAQPAYLIAQLKVSDLNAYMQNYGMPVFPLLAEAGAEVLVGAQQVNVLEGESGATWTAVVKFPSMEALDAWYTSDAYKALAPERRKLSDQAVSTLVAAPGFVMPQQ